MRAFKSLLFVSLWLALAPTLAFAQASITGLVRDSSGAALPGVTVEAASPASASPWICSAIAGRRSR
jgi:hypothetical protein